MHADEVDTDVALVAQLLQAQFPQWANLRIEPVASAGTDNALYRLGDDMVVRLPRIKKAEKHIDKEHHWLPRLSPLLPVAIPRPIAKGQPIDGYPYHWSVYSWLDGETPAAGDIANPEQLAKELGEFVAALHRVGLPDGPAARRGAPLVVQDEPARAAITELHGLIDTDAATAIWDADLQAPAWTGQPVWVHGDLMPMNLLVRDGHLSAVIDFGGLGIGDPACDLIVAWNFLPASVRHIFREVVGVDDATWQRGRGWAFSMALIQLPYYKDTNPVMAANARFVIGEVLADCAMS